MRSHDIHLRVLSLEDVKIPINKTRFENCSFKMASRSPRVDIKVGSTMPIRWTPEGALGVSQHFIKVSWQPWPCPWGLEVWIQADYQVMISPKPIQGSKLVGWLAQASCVSDKLVAFMKFRLGFGNFCNHTQRSRREGILDSPCCQLGLSMLFPLCRFYIVVSVNCI